MTPEHVHKQLELHRHRISSQIALISHLRNAGRVRESEDACKELGKMLDSQTGTFKDLWRIIDKDAPEKMDEVMAECPL